MTSPYHEFSDQVRSAGDCDEWTGFVHQGSPLWRGTSPARVAFEIANERKPLIRRMVSLCGNRLCVRPEHHADTIADVIAWRQAPGPNGCVLYTGLLVNGYGWLRLGNEFWRPHRWVWQEAHGPIPDDMVIDHLCNQSACIRLDHLRCVTQGENGLAAHSNSPAGVNARKTHCIRGHPFAGNNLIIERSATGTTRVCRECRRLRKEKTRRARR